MNCKRCQWPVTPDPEHADEHPELCCDCFDESWGMPVTQRTNPRTEHREVDRGERNE